MADSKVADLTAITTLGGDELVYVVDDPSGTPVDRKITAKNLLHSSLVGFRVLNTADSVIATATTTYIAFTSEDFDTDAGHDNATNNSRYTIPTGMGGKWLIGAAVRWQTNATGQRIVFIQVNRTTTLVQPGLPASSVANLGFTPVTVASLAAGDYVEVGVYQNSGGNQNVEGSQITTVMFGVWLSA